MALFLELLPMILGTALAPAWLIVVLLILRGQDGLIKAAAFVVGTTIMRLLQGVVFSSVLRNAEDSRADGAPTPVVSALLLVLGILLLISMVKKLLNEDDPDAPPPKWMTTFDRAKAPTLLGMGAVGTLIAPKLWVFTLSALGIILAADLGSGAELWAFFFYILASEALLILPLLLYAITPRRATSLLQSASDWLMSHNKPITVAVSLIFGCLFLWKGLSGLSA